MTADPAELNFDEPRIRVGVIAAQLNRGQERTLAALQDAFPIRFERVDRADPDLNGLAGLLLLMFDPAFVENVHAVNNVPADLPRLVLPSPPHSDSDAQQYGADVRAASDRAPIPVVLADELGLARPLRGRTIPERARVHADAGAGELPSPPATARTLAGVDGKPVWWQIDDGTTGGTASLSASAYSLAELGEDEALREHLCAGRFMGLLPLVHFLTQILGADGWRLPPPRASFVIDDPNLHWPSYGFIDYRELIAHATRHGYHLGFATVPLDGWLADRRVTALLTRNASALSLSIHGNDHIARELDQLSTDAQAQAAIAQALRRIAALEHRSGVSVDRVMVPPHSACSEPALRAMFLLGLDAACSTKPHPWRYDLPAATPLDGWRPAELVAGGIPVLPRYPFSAQREDLALQALLGHPLILYGHHEDFAQGLDFLAQAASDIRMLGDEVQWGSLSWIARGNFATRRLGETLLVRMHARRVEVEVPAGVRELRLLIDEPLGGAAGHRVAHARGLIAVTFADDLGVSEPLAINSSTPDTRTQIELTLTPDRPLNPASVPAPTVRLWPFIRRALAEGRDRAQPLRR
jgi:hypothetical protein